MARRRPAPDSGGSWLLAEELFDRGDPAFVDELHHVTDANKLGHFAARWHADPRPAARQMVFDYLARPLNAYRHEALVKRLYKIAEAAGDDQLLARFLVAFDRSVRRVRRKKRRYDWQSRESWTEEFIQVPPGTALPRTPNDLAAAPERQKPLQRLFSVHTRYYLRRRSWRYFRKLGNEHPDRYVPAVAEALKQYTDDDVRDGLALIDNWGLMHVLFHHSPAVKAQANGWRPAEFHTLADLGPAPAYEPLWVAARSTLLDLLTQARCRPVRQWTIGMLRRHHPTAVANLPLERLLGLLVHEDPELSLFAAESLRKSPELVSIGLDRWLALIDTTTNPHVLEVLCELVADNLKPEAVTLEQAVKLAVSRPLPVARLGLTWLKAKQPVSEADCRALLGLAEAQAEPVRPELVRWARGVLSRSEHFRPDWVLEYLDSRHEDVRAEGWAWFQEDERARNYVELWRRLLESPYDDVRFHLVAELEERAGRPLSAERSKLDPELVRFLWASVLLNVHRGNRTKPVVVGQMVRRINRRPEDAPALLPVLGVALRSVRGPEWRAGLSGVMQLVERNPELAPAVRGAFPELRWN